MNVALRLAAVQGVLDALVPEDEDALPPCRDPFHDHFDHRELAAPLFSGLTERPPAPLCPSCCAPRQSGGPFVTASADALRWHPEPR